MGEDEKTGLSDDAKRWMESDENSMNRLIRQTAKAAGQPEPSTDELDKMRDNAGSNDTR